MWLLKSSRKNPGAQAYEAGDFLYIFLRFWSFWGSFSYKNFSYKKNRVTQLERKKMFYGNFLSCEIIELHNWCSSILTKSTVKLICFNIFHHQVFHTVTSVKNTNDCIRRRNSKGTTNFNEYVWPLSWHQALKAPSVTSWHQASIHSLTEADIHRWSTSSRSETFHIIQRKIPVLQTLS